MSPYNLVLERLSACVNKIQHLNVLENETCGLSRVIQVKSSIEKCEASKLLVTIIDRILLCGLKKPTEGYWPVFNRFCCKETISEFSKNKYVKTSLGKGRLWLYHSLNENILESYLIAVNYDQQLLDKNYMATAYMKSESFRSLFVTVISGLEHVSITLELASCLDQYPCDIGFENHVEVDLIINDAPDVACDALELDNPAHGTPSSSRNVVKSWKYVGARQAREEVPVVFEPVCLQHVSSKTKSKHKQNQNSVNGPIDPPITDLSLNSEVKLRHSKSGHLKRVSFHENSKRSSWSSDSNYYSMVKSSSGLSLSSCLSGCVDKNFNPALTERWDPDGQEDPPLKQSHSLLNLDELVQRLDSPSQPNDVLNLTTDVNLFNKLNRLFLSSKQRRKTREEIAELVREYKLKFHGDVLMNKRLVPCPQTHYIPVDGDSEDPLISTSCKPGDDNHFLLKLKLEVFVFDDERTFRVYPILGDHCEGQNSKSLVIVSNRQMYIVKPLAPNSAVKDGHKFFSVLCSIPLDELCRIEVGLEYQNLRIHSNSENIVISTGSRSITQNLISYVYFLKSSPPSIKFRFDYHVSMLRCLLATSNINSESILYYGFVHWEDFESNWDVHSEANIKEGDLMYVISHDDSFSNKWNPCFATLKRGVFHLFNLVDSNSPSLALPLMPNIGQIGISGCRRTPESFRPHTFELVLSNNSSVLLAASNEGDVNAWIIAITESVASTGKGVITCDPLPCVIIITSSTIQLLQHTSWSFNYSRTVAKCSHEDIIKLWYIEGVPVCRIALSGVSNEYINDWYLYFVTDEQCALFVDCLFGVFKNQLNKNLERHVMDPAIEDHVLDRHSKIYFTMLHAHY